MKLDRKLELVQQNIDSLVTHTDADGYTLKEGLNLVRKYCDDWELLLNAYIDRETANAFGGAAQAVPVESEE